MNTIPPIAPGTGDAVFALTLALLLVAPLAIAGVALINAGLGRSRSAAQALLGNLALVAIAAIVFALVGASFAGTLGNSAVVIHAGGTTWSVLGQGPFLLRDLNRAAPQAQLALLFEFLAVAMVALLPWGSGADRWRLAGGCASAAVLAGIVFPLAAHWIWNGGWLARLGLNFGLGAGFLDAGGAGTVHVIGGVSALAVVWLAGPRRGKFPKEGLSTAMPGHNAAYVLFGCLIALVGWLAWNVAGALVWMHSPLTDLPGTAIDTLLSASGALAATFLVTRFRFGKPDASLCANGWLAGLVASSACAAIVSPGAALFVGAVAGIFTRCWSKSSSWRYQSTIRPVPSRCTAQPAFGDCWPRASFRRSRASSSRSSLESAPCSAWCCRSSTCSSPSSTASSRSASIPTAKGSVWTCTNLAAAPIRSSSSTATSRTTKVGRSEAMPV